MILNYLSQFVASFNSDSKPFLSSAWKALLRTECDEALSKSIDEYNGNTRDFLSKHIYGIDPLLLHEERQNLKDNAFQTFSSVSYVKLTDEPLFKSYLAKLLEGMNDVDKKVDDLNYDLCSKYCEEMIQSLYAEYLKDPQWESKNEFQILEQFNKDWLCRYIAESPKLINIEVLSNQLSDLTKSFFEQYENFKVGEAKQKKNSSENFDADEIQSL